MSRLKEAPFRAPEFADSPEFDAGAANHFRSLGDELESHQAACGEAEKLLDRALRGEAVGAGLIDSRLLAEAFDLMMRSEIGADGGGDDQATRSVLLAEGSAVSLVLLTLHSFLSGYAGLGWAFRNPEAVQSRIREVLEDREFRFLEEASGRRVREDLARARNRDLEAARRHDAWRRAQSEITVNPQPV